MLWWRLWWFLTYISILEFHSKSKFHLRPIQWKPKKKKKEYHVSVLLVWYHQSVQEDPADQFDSKRRRQHHDFSPKKIHCSFRARSCVHELWQVLQVSLQANKTSSMSFYLRFPSIKLQKGSGSENVTRASNNIVLSRISRKEFWVNYPFDIVALNAKISQR